MGDPLQRKRYASVTVTDVGFGLGIGASLGVVVLLGMNYASPQEMKEEAKSFSDLDYALELAVLDLKAVKGPFEAIRKSFPTKAAASKLASLLMKGDHVRGNHDFVTASGDALIKDMQSTKLDMGRKRIIAIAVPGGGIGLQAYIGVKATGTNVQSWGADDMSKVSFVGV